MADDRWQMTDGQMIRWSDDTVTPPRSDALYQKELIMVASTVVYVCLVALLAAVGLTSQAERAPGYYAAESAERRLCRAAGSRCSAAGANVRVARGWLPHSARPVRVGLAVPRGTHAAGRCARCACVRGDQDRPRRRNPAVSHTDLDPPRRTTGATRHPQRRFDRAAARRRHTKRLCASRRRRAQGNWSSARWSSRPLGTPRKAHAGGFPANAAARIRARNDELPGDT